MAKNKLIIISGATIVVSCLLVFFQNCSGSKSSDAAAPTCSNVPVLKNAYPEGKSFSIPSGVINTPFSCSNQSSYDTLVFNANNQSVKLSGSSGELTFSLSTGGVGCNSGIKTGGDTWTTSDKQFTLETNRSESTFQITFGSDISCTVSP